MTETPPDATRERARLLVNLRSTRCPASLDPLVEALEARWRVRWEGIDDPSAFGDAIRRAAPEAEVLVIASGDGTLGRSGSTLVEVGRPVGVVPIGNANDLARGLGMPLDPVAACQALTGASVRRIDVGRANGHTFFNAMTMGIGTAVSRSLDVDTKRRLGRLSQALHLLGAVRQRRSFRAEVTDASGRMVRVRSVHIEVGNGRTHGGGILLAEDARIDDARLDLSSVPPGGIWRLVALAPALTSGRRRAHPRVHAQSGTRFRIVTKPVLEIATDGDTVARTPVDIEVLPSALPMLIPDPAEAPAISAPREA